MCGPQGRWQNTVYSWSVTCCIIVRKTQTSFTHYFTHDLIPIPLTNGCAVACFLKAQKDFGYLFIPHLCSFVQFPEAAQTILNKFLLSICLWKYLFLFTPYLGNLPLNCRSIYVNILKNNSFPGYLSTLEKPLGDAEWSITWVYHSCSELTEMLPPSAGLLKEQLSKVPTGKEP